MRIWDNHTHLMNTGSWLPGATAKDRLDLLAEIGQSVGISRFNVFIEMDNTETARNLDYAAGLAAHAGRMFGYLWITITDDAAVQNTLNQINRWIGNDVFVGIKMGGSSGKCNRPGADPVFARAIELDAVIYIHTWMRTGGSPPTWGGLHRPLESVPADVVELAQRYPGYKFVCGHNGGDWELGTRDVIDQPNVLMELSGGFPWRGQMDLAVAELGAERVIYGSDVHTRAFATQLARVWGARISNAQKQMIFNDNLENLTMPILINKGISLA